MREPFLKGQGGFTLPEVMVTMFIMMMIFFALHSIFDISIRVFSFGNDKVEAVENARIGLDKMEREIRAAYPVKGASSAGADRYRFFNANGSTTSPARASLSSAWSAQITFGNELNNATQPTGNGVIDCNPSGAAAGTPTYTPCEYITYKVTNAGGAACDSSPCTLRRVNAANSSATGEPVVEFVSPDGLRFKYLTANGTAINPSSPGTYTQDDIARVEIALRVTKDGGSQTLSTEVALRNPGRIHN